MTSFSYHLRGKNEIFWVKLLMNFGGHISIIYFCNRRQMSFLFKSQKLQQCPHQTKVTKNCGSNTTLENLQLKNANFHPSVFFNHL